MLLQLLDDGRLTDGQGRTVDFRNTIVIMTSNLGSELWLNGGGTQEQVNQVLRAAFRPEFLNRIDEVVVFHTLDRQQLKQIVDIQLRRVTELLQGKGFRLVVDDSAREYLAETGYDPDYGARPLKRAIQRELQDPLALHILSGDFPAGAVIRVTKGAEGLEFSTAQVAEVGV